ncbi:MAG TPA: bifunctional diaminohydroxyphosphoribosylaminopyrimidine deaminase/5-amino-6-(5-phosphoribosylamino)uracil reductase RibD, partial [Nitrospiria bacterium]|nr:bifunctional diaminohydroxyphosphoribosylaminopyrimidine deaminase/5-amino-6-(5-phosphoribosylamino)uracil reductase RibD [Nitrospiria bacterium]
PNPLVGAILVKRGKKVGAGYHLRSGLPHAEINALAEAGEHAKGATLYLNLEPCCHREKKTPPCVGAILKSGVRQVVVAMRDPNPAVNGKGIAFLKGRGIEIREGVCRETGLRLNEKFTRYIRTGLPFVSLKIAATLDGKIATRTGESRWITGEAARRIVHRLRNSYDAVLTGSGTVRADNPELTVRLLRGKTRNPARIVADSNFSLPAESAVFTRREGERVIVAALESASAEKMGRFRALGLEVISLPENEGGIDLPELVLRLGKMGMTSLLIEAGGKLSLSALRSGIVDKVYYFIAPAIMGGDDALSAFRGTSPSALSDLIRLKRFSMNKAGEDYLLEGYLREESYQDKT